MLSRKRFFAVTLAILGTVGLYAYLKPSAPKSSNDKVVEIRSVQKTTIQQKEKLIGTLHAKHQANLRSKTRGILEIKTLSGACIKKGQLIALVDNNDLEKNYAILQEAENIAEKQFDRTAELSKTGVSNKSIVEEKKALLLDAQKKVSDAKIALEETKIYAPFDGMVGIFKFREGAQVHNGDFLVPFYDPQTMIVEFHIPVSMATEITTDSRVIVLDKTYPLTVQKMLDEETRMCPAYAHIQCDNCITGTTVDVTLVLQERACLVIPFEAVFLREGKTCVYTFLENKAVLKPVTLGIRHEKLVEITAGLQEGDAIIVEGHSRLQPDMAVLVCKK
jgi:membrane fusion protein (multidrug efflux system)